jgi:FixJ family two-component response regulator
VYNYVCAEISAPRLPAILLFLRQMPLGRRPKRNHSKVRNRNLDKLAGHDHQVAELVKLRYFAGLTNRQAAEALGIAPRTADFHWAYARAWLLAELQGRGG